MDATTDVDDAKVGGLYQIEQKIVLEENVGDENGFYERISG